MKRILRLLCSLGLVSALLLIGSRPIQVSTSTTGEPIRITRGGVAAYAIAPHSPDASAAISSFIDEGRGRPASPCAQAGGQVAGIASSALPCLAAGPDAPARESGNAEGRMAGIVSSVLSCLSPDGGPLCGPSGIVHLSWSGDVARARLVLHIAGADAPHTIRVNGQAAVRVLVLPEERVEAGEYIYLTLPPGIVVQGENRIELTDDALIGDSWTARQVRLEVLGDVTSAEQTSTGDAAIAATTHIFTFTSPYDGSSQEALYQLPDSYTGSSPTPLVIYAHGRNGTMEYGLDDLGDAANAKGWLLASPQMHGSWIIPEECYTYPNDCDYGDKVLTGTRSENDEAEPGAYAHASLESQYDIIGAARFMIDHFNVKLDQIYLVGYSMGGQIATVTAAKFPHVFAAIFDNKGITDLEQWYVERSSSASTVRTLEKECHIDGTPKTPAQNPFCYERRSSVSFARNYAHIPISITHSLADHLVPPHHANDLYTRIKAFYPDHPVAVYWDRTQGPTCPPNNHCLTPDPGAVLDFLSTYTLQASPARVHITSDESKSYYWLHLDPEEEESWVHVLQAAYDRTYARVTAIISTTSPVQVGLNLGATSVVGPAGIPVPGIGLPPTQYRVWVNGQSSTRDYAYGYLNVSLPAAGRFTVALAALSFCDTPGLIRAIERANDAGQAVTLRLERGCTYTLSDVNNRTDGANGLPSIRGTLTIEGNGARIERSRAAGAPDLRLFHVASGGSLTLQQVALGNGSATQGGAIYNRGAVTLIDSTLSGNEATDGGAIYVRRGSVELINSTVSGNQAGDQGGSIYDRAGAVALVGSTVSRSRASSGGGIYLVSGATMSLRNAIVAGNLSGGDCALERVSDVTSEGYNVDGDGSCALDSMLGDRPNVDPGLGPLANYGGPTPTHALYANSPAVDRIPPGANGCGASPLDEDQRGEQRPADGNGDGASACDVGAFERQPGETLIGQLSWTAEARVGSVRLSWRTGVEASNVGFDLWRSETMEGAYHKINPTRIPARGSASSGASYSYVDADVLGDAYFYKLEAVNAYGRSTYYGPVVARLTWVRHTYLPLVRRP